MANGPHNIIEPPHGHGALAALANAIIDEPQLKLLRGEDGTGFLEVPANVRAQKPLIPFHAGLLIEAHEDWPPGLKPTHCLILWMDPAYRHAKRGSEMNDIDFERVQGSLRKQFGPELMCFGIPAPAPNAPTLTMIMAANDHQAETLQQVSQRIAELRGPGTALQP